MELINVSSLFTLNVCLKKNIFLSFFFYDGAFRGIFKKVCCTLTDDGVAVIKIVGKYIIRNHKGLRCCILIFSCSSCTNFFLGVQSNLLFLHIWRLHLLCGNPMMGNPGRPGWRRRVLRNKTKYRVTLLLNYKKHICHQTNRPRVQELENEIESPEN